MTMTADKCRAGRALLNWTQIRLADESGIAASTINLFENGRKKPRGDTLAALVKAFAKAGIEITKTGVERLA